MTKSIKKFFDAIDRHLDDSPPCIGDKDEFLDELRNIFNDDFTWVCNLFADPCSAEKRGFVFPHRGWLDYLSKQLHKFYCRVITDPADKKYNALYFPILAKLNKTVIEPLDELTVHFNSDERIVRFDIKDLGTAYCYKCSNDYYRTLSKLEAAMKDVLEYAETSLTD